jgi:hypothetical protein
VDGSIRDPVQDPLDLEVRYGPLDLEVGSGPVRDPLDLSSGPDLRYIQCLI